MNGRTIVIAGMGLIGGSLGLAFKKAYGGAVRVVGVDQSEAARLQAAAAGAADCCRAPDDCAAAVAAADVVFLCTPVLQMIPALERLLPHLRPGAIISDVGSAKSFLAAGLMRLLPPEFPYVAGHPMAGGERSGVAAADAALFKGKCYIIIPETCNEPAAVRTICDLLRCTGARLTMMELSRHDRAAAAVSHVPHVTAAALVNLLDRGGDADSVLKLAGGGFKDTTRIASSDADMWSDICLSNPEPIVDGLREMQALFESVIGAIGAGDRAALHAFFKKAKARRDSLLTASHGLYER